MDFHFAILNKESDIVENVIVSSQEFIESYIGYDNPEKYFIRFDENSNDMNKIPVIGLRFVDGIFKSPETSTEEPAPQKLPTEE